MLRELKLIAVGVLVGCLVAALFVFWSRHEAVAVAGDLVPAEAVLNPDSSVTLAKEAASKPVRRMATPSNAKVVRQVSVTIQPDDPECASAVAWLDVTQDVEGVTRVTASSPSGVVTSGRDVLIFPASNKGRWLAGPGVDRGHPSIAFGKEFDNLVVLGAVSGKDKATLGASLWVMFAF